MKIPYRHNEAIWLKKGKEDQVVVIFSVTFADKNDWVVAEVFLREFADVRRDPSVICIVEEPSDVIAVERTHDFKGVYHVLHGAISPLDGRGPEQLRIAELVRRLEADQVTEIVVATNPNVEGEATAVYLARLIKPLGVTVSRIAHGLPVGGNLEYADQVTIGRALEGRRRM